MTKEPRKRERLISPKELEQRHLKHPVSTEPQRTGERTPLIPAPGPLSSKRHLQRPEDKS